MTRRILITLTGILVVAGAVTPTALADASGPPPLQAAHFDGRSPDTRDAAYAAHHGRGVTYNVAVGYATPLAGPPLNGVGYDGRSPDTRDAASNAHHNPDTKKDTIGATAGPPLNGAGYDGRSTDTQDAATLAHTSSVQVALASSSGFAWGDAAIGAAVALLAVLAIAVSARALRRRRRPISLPS